MLFTLNLSDIIGSIKFHQSPLILYLLFIGVRRTRRARPVSTADR